jgi:hypothetical protein
VIQGHFNKILVKEGENIPEAAVIGLEGNKGFVFSGGQRITTEMQKAGDKRGTHTHTSYRPVQRVRTIKSGQHYLNTAKGTRYKDKDGYYYQIVYRDNNIKGHVDPYWYQDEDDWREKLAILARLVPWVKARLARY